MHSQFFTFQHDIKLTRKLWSSCAVVLLISLCHQCVATELTTLNPVDYQPSSTGHFGASTRKPYVRTFCDPTCLVCFALNPMSTQTCMSLRWQGSLTSTCHWEPDITAACTCLVWRSSLGQAASTPSGMAISPLRLVLSLGRYTGGEMGRSVLKKVGRNFKI